MVDYIFTCTLTKIKKMKKGLFLFAAVFFLLTSCKKESQTCTLSVAGISGSYKLTAVLFKADANTPEVDVFLDPNYFEACERDNIVTLNSNGTYTVSDGAIACSPSDADSGLWSLNGNTLTVDTEALGISDFSCSGFKVKESDLATGASVTRVFARQ